MTLGSCLIQTIAPAILPPLSEEDESLEYYTVLGLSNNKNNKQLTPSDVRRAYKDQSRQWHPDKIAQKHGSDWTDEQREDARQRYERIQQAAAVLSDPDARTLYHAYGCRVARYEFVAQNWGNSSSTLDPVGLHMNLVRAPWYVRTRLVLAMVAILGVVLTQPVLVCAKANAVLEVVHDNDNSIRTTTGFVETPWWIVLIPTWIVYGLYIVVVWIWGTVLAVKRCGSTNHTSAIEAVSMDAVTLVLGTLQHCAIMAGGVWLALVWEKNYSRSSDSPTTTNWHVVMAPWYAAIILGVLRSIQHVQVLGTALTCMATELHIASQYTLDGDGNDNAKDETESDHGNDDNDDTEGAPDDTFFGLLRDATEEQRTEIRHRFIVVHPDPDTVARTLAAVRLAQVASANENENANKETTDGGDNDNTTNSNAMDLSPEEMEDIRIQCSPEYEAIVKDMQRAVRTGVRYVTVYLTVLLLLVFKVQPGNSLDDLSWWLVALPFWVSLGVPCMRQCLVCMCAGIDEEHEMEMEGWKPDDDGDDDNMDAAELGESTANAAAPSTTTDAANATAPSSMFSDTAHEKQGSASSAAMEKEGTTTTKHQTGPTASTEVTKGSQTPANATANSDVSVTTKDEAKEQGADTDDEEAFRRWQERYQEGAAGELAQAKLKAFGGCCGACFQIIMLCLIVGKLEQSYDTADDDDGSPGYNAFWILFPIFFVAGIILLACSCCIYARDDTLDVEGANNSNSSSAPSAPADGTTIVIPVPASTDPVESSHHTGEPEVALDVEQGTDAGTAAVNGESNDPPGDGNMEDLD